MPSFALQWNEMKWNDWMLLLGRLMAWNRDTFSDRVFLCIFANNRIPEWPCLTPPTPPRHDAPPCSRATARFEDFDFLNVGISKQRGTWNQLLEYGINYLNIEYQNRWEYWIKYLNIRLRQMQHGGGWWSLRKGRIVGYQHTCRTDELFESIFGVSRFRHPAIPIIWPTVLVSKFQTECSNLYLTYPLFWCVCFKSCFFKCLNRNPTWRWCLWRASATTPTSCTATTTWSYRTTVGASQICMYQFIYSVVYIWWYTRLLRFLFVGLYECTTDVMGDSFFWLNVWTSDWILSCLNVWTSERLNVSYLSVWTFECLTIWTFEHLKCLNSDYKGMDPKVALDDFIQRVKAYEAVGFKCLNVWMFESEGSKSWTFVYIGAYGWLYTHHLYGHIHIHTKMLYTEKEAMISSSGSRPTRR
jgi:hypothetical protein